MSFRHPRFRNTLLLTVITAYVAVASGGEFLHRLYHWLEDSAASAHAVVAAGPAAEAVSFSATVDGADERCFFAHLLSRAIGSGHQAENSFDVPVHAVLGNRVAPNDVLFRSIRKHPSARPRAPPLVA